MSSAARTAVDRAARLHAVRHATHVAVRMETVTRQDLVGVVSASGWIQPHRKVDVQADLMGRIARRPLRP